MTDNTITLEKQYKDIQELNKKLNASLNTLKTRTGDLEKANHNLENNFNSCHLADYQLKQDENIHPPYSFHTPVIILPIQFSPKTASF